MFGYSPTYYVVPHFKCSRVSKSLVYSVNETDIFVVLPCAVHDSLTLSLCSFAPRPFLILLFPLVFHILYMNKLFFNNSQEDHIFMKK